MSIAKSIENKMISALMVIYIQNISCESSNDDEDPGWRSVTHVDNESETSSSVISNSVIESTEMYSSAVSQLSVLKAPKPSDLSRKCSVF